MKKIVLLLSFMPLALFAQNSNAPTLQKFHSPREGYVSPVQNHSQPKPTASAPVTHHGGIYPGTAYVPATLTNIGTTVYELQTNGALAKRLQVYSAGNISYVWIKSDDPTDKNFDTRYSGYNSFNGSSWLTSYGNTTQFEFDRSGWPSIGELTTNGNTYEMLTSHYAAAVSTVYAGGIYWYTNTAIGEANFTQDKTIDPSTNRALTTGLLWPRMATSNNRIYLIGTYEDDRKISGVYNPIVYFCYNTTTSKFESKNITLPGYDSTRYGTGSADEYSIDARGQYVAIVTGGFETDLALWKSSDSGKTFTKTIINNFAQSPFNPKSPTMYTDTAIADDGTCSVTLDNNGVAHVSYTPIKTINPSGDSGVSYQPFVTDSITYWNDRDQKKIYVGGCVDYQKNGDIAFGPNQTTEDYAGYDHDYATFSNIAVDPSGNIYVVFSAPHEDDLDEFGDCFRHVYCSVYNAATSTWLPQQDIVQTWQYENVYATVARDADSKLHLVFMQHGVNDNAGIYWPQSTTNQNPESTDTMIYEEVSTGDLLSQKVGLIDLGVNENIANNLFSTGAVYPNPAADMLNLSLNLTRPATVTVKMTNMLGEEMQAQNYDMLPSGKNNLQFGVNSLSPGVYLCNISAGGYTATERVVIER